MLTQQASTLLVARMHQFFGATHSLCFCLSLNLASAVNLLAMPNGAELVHFTQLAHVLDTLRLQTFRASCLLSCLVDLAPSSRAWQ